MEIRQLITFRKIVDAGSYTAAAMKLGYTQSTITSHIKALEAEIGGELFTYVKRELKLTTLGKELIPLADELLHMHYQISQLNSQNKVSGELKIAAPESLTITRIGPILRDFLNLYSDVKIILSNGPAERTKET
jgi:DNA-binding transcriptional LysR family regulator